MNEDVLKPFPCKQINCGMSFFTEDHLSVHHQAKHNKLNLEIPKDTNLIFADQTPTPTRLLNNCEELRVFDDLQNINPFEEHFRRAAEDNSNGIVRESTFLIAPSNQDTLHTPQILPHFDNQPMKSEPNVEAIEQDGSKKFVRQSSLEDLAKTSQVEQTTRNLNSHKPPIPLLPQPNIIYAAPLNLAECVDVSKTNASVKDKLKSIILSNNGSQSQTEKKRIKTEPISTIFIGSVPLVATTTNLIINSNASSLKKSSATVVQPTTTKIEGGGGSRKRTRSEKTEASSLKVERNRAAARRYRTKMKIQSQALQEKYDKSQRELASLKKELTELKKELTQVKTFLLLHKECSVSKAMTSNS